MRDEALYILRLWCDGDAKDDWRYSLENLHTRERQNFARFNDLAAFLAERTAERPHPQKAR